MTDTSSETIGQAMVYCALLEAQQALAAVAKTARASYGGEAQYAYVSADEMITQARRALHGAGLVLYRSGMRLCGSREAAHTHIECDYALCHIATGQCVQFTGIPWYIVEARGRPLDKALATASTTSLSYFLRDLLLVPRCSDDDMDARNDSTHEHGVMGAAGAARIQSQLAQAMLGEGALRSAMSASGVAVPMNMEEWSAEWIPRIFSWIERNTAMA